MSRPPSLSPLAAINIPHHHYHPYLAPPLRILLLKDSCVDSLWTRQQSLVTQPASHPPPLCSVLLKDSFVDSFPPRDRPFMRQFVESQMFEVYCDAVI